MPSGAKLTDLPILLSDDQVSGMLGLPVQTVRNLHRTNQLRGKVIGRHLRWLRADIDRFVESLEGDRNDQG